MNNDRKGNDMNGKSWAAVGLLLLVGCGQRDFQASDEYNRSPIAASPNPAGEETPKFVAAQANAVVDEAAPDGAQAKAARKIVYRATVVLDVQDFGATEKQLAAEIASTGGYVATFHEERQLGELRGGHWVVRVPVERFDKFVEAVSHWGVPCERSVQAEDMTEEFVDLSARLKNKQQLETRLLELVAQRGDAIQAVLALEAELSRVREEIERMQGRLRYMSDRVALTTVDITAREQREYLPPEAPTFAGQLRATFFASFRVLRQFGETCLLVLIAITPWLIVFVPLGLLAYYCLRRRLRRWNTPVAATVV
jgi:hypothetical protein